jgi:hypothetical protein
VHRTTRAAILSAVATAAALGLGGCGAHPEDKPADSAMQTLPPITGSPTIPDPQAAGPAVAPLPPPTALIDVMNRISDAGVPGADKTGLVESATPSDAESLDGFGKALSQTGYAPVTWEATDLRWAQETPGNVRALVTLRAVNPQVRGFTFPMEFISVDNSWQLTRRTADTLLHHGEDVPPVPTPKPTP